jgi:hypothetical protein
METYDPKTANTTNMQFLFSKTFPKIINILTIIEILKRIKIAWESTWNEESNAQKDIKSRDFALTHEKIAQKDKLLREMSGVCGGYSF